MLYKVANMSSINHFNKRWHVRLNLIHIAELVLPLSQESHCYWDLWCVILDYCSRFLCLICKRRLYLPWPRGSSHQIFTWYCLSLATILDALIDDSLIYYLKQLSYTPRGACQLVCGREENFLFSHVRGRSMAVMPNEDDLLYFLPQNSGRG